MNMFPEGKIVRVNNHQTKNYYKIFHHRDKEKLSAVPDSQDVRRCRIIYQIIVKPFDAMASINIGRTRIFAKISQEIAGETRK